MKIFGSYLSVLQKNLVRKIYYKVIGSLSFGQRMRFSAIKSLLDLNEDEIILDAGSGEGSYSLQFAINNGCTVIGVDLSKENIEKAKKRAKDLRVNNVQFISGDLCDLPFSNNIFDKAICLEVLEHISKDDRAIIELNRVLKEKGELILTIPHEQVETRRFLYFGRAAEDHVRDGYNPNLLVKKLEYNNFKVLSIRFYARYFEEICLLYTSPSPRDRTRSRMPSSA